MFVKKRHATFILNAHLIFIVKYRKKVLFDSQLTYLEKLFNEILEENDCKLIEFNGELDHVHRDFPDTAFNLNQKSSLWTRSYFAGSVGGVTLEILKNYIKNQDRPKY